jgi:hypothetical protein
LSSPSFEIKAANVPDPPINLLMNSQSRTEIQIQWEAPLDDGNDSILDYLVYWDAGRADNVFDLLTSTTAGQTGFTKSDSLVAGTYY